MKSPIFINKILLPAVALFLTAGSLLAQVPVKMHSHNDYRRDVPFFQAYMQDAYSIEADVYTNADKTDLLVAHDRDELPTALTIDELYINPIVTMFKFNKGKVRKNSNTPLLLLVDLKTEEHPTLDILVKKLEKYPEVFNPNVNPHAVKVVISGHSSKPEDFKKYPEFIYFDGRPHINYSTEQLKRVGLISESFKKYSQWKGLGNISDADQTKLKEVIQKVHRLGKDIRLWGTPDGVNSWNIFHNMGFDIINTDMPEACMDYFRKK